MYRRTLFALIGALTLFSLTVPAAEAQTPTQVLISHGLKIQGLVRGFDLTSAENRELKTIFRDNGRSFRAIMKQNGFKRGARPTKAQVRKVKGPLASLRRKTEARVKKVLSAAQYRKYRAATDRMNTAFLSALSRSTK